MIRSILLTPVLWTTFSIAAQTPASPATFASLHFLEGSWQARTQPSGSAGATLAGTYTFAPELGGHILARHSSTGPNGCKGPASFDCDHGDLLYIYNDASGQPLKAIYFDNEGHTLHYDVFTPDPTTAILLSEPNRPGPRFRLVYHLEGSVLSGKFQMQPPGASEWRSYLEWSGPKL